MVQLISKFLDLLNLKHNRHNLVLLLGSQRTQELGLLFGGLEASVSELGGGIDELEVDLFQVLSGSVLHHGLTKDQRSLLDTDDGTLEHEPVLVDFTIVDESSHRGDSLLGQIGFGLATGLVVLLSNTVDLLVELGTVEVSVLTGTGDGGGNTGRVPRSNTGDLSQTSVSLTRKTGDSPTGGDTFVTMTLGNSDDINVFVLVEDGVTSDFLFEQALGEVDLSGGVSSVDLDFHDVGLLQTKVELLDLGVGDNTDDGAELLDALEFGFDVLATILGVLLGVLGVGLFLGTVPVLVHATLEFFVQVLGEDGGESTETLGGFNVSDDTNNNHRRSFDDGDGIDDLTLVHKGTSTVDSTNDVGHTGLVSTEGGQVRGITGVVLREGSDLTKVLFGTLLGQETQVTLTGCFELSVRHGEGGFR
jgi:hypothetical protein